METSRPSCPDITTEKPIYISGLSPEDKPYHIRDLTGQSLPKGTMVVSHLNVISCCLTALYPRELEHQM